MRKLLIVLLVAFVFRLALIPFITNGDLLTQAEWGKFLYRNDTHLLYSHNQWLGEWPNHPPLISWFYKFVFQVHSFFQLVFTSLGNFIALNRLAPTKFIWFFDFTKWYGTTLFPVTNIEQGVTATIKFFIILSDLLIASLIYLVCRQAKVNWPKYVLAYLFLPFSWYLSSWWGQSDPMAYVFLISGFILLNTKYLFMAPVLMAISVNLKPTGLILLPLFLWVFIKQKRQLTHFILGSLAGIFLTLFVFSQFTNHPLLKFLISELPHRLFESKQPFTVVSSFNFWFIFHAKDLVSDQTPYLFISAKYWGYLIFAIISLISFLVVRRQKLDTIFLSIFISGFGGWLFLTNMYERYVFAGLISLLFYSIYHRQYFKYFIILSLIFWCNLYHGWWQPSQLEFLKNVFLWSNRLIPKILSFVNLVIYLKIIKSIGLRSLFGSSA
ncbi:MAG TPA: hypothetical protein PK370_03330 [Candidatus Woesebacteria bacterium]|mgnify:FL=1|nr:hypothetical protein [Candidatus Woesebacteria bacterium]